MITVRRTHSPKRLAIAIGLILPMLSFLLPYFAPVTAATLFLKANSLYRTFLPARAFTVSYNALLVDILDALSRIAELRAAQSWSYLYTLNVAFEHAPLLGIYYGALLLGYLVAPLALALGLYLAVRCGAGLPAILGRASRLVPLIGAYRALRAFERWLPQQLKTREVMVALRYLLRSILPYPASTGHHLPHIGGLVQHSLEVAQRSLEAARHTSLTRDEINVLLVAALLHDVGKCETMFLQGPLDRWGGESSTTLSFLRFLLTARGPLSWVKLSSLRDDHPERSARTVARLFEPMDAVFSFRAANLVRNHHIHDPGQDKLLQVLVHADREMTGEELEELKDAVADTIVGVVKSFTPNLPVDDKVMVLYTADLPDVLFVNSFLLRDKIIQALKDLGYTIHSRRIYGKVEAMDKIIWETVREMGFKKDLPGITARQELVPVRLGKVVFKMLPLDIHRFYTPEQIRMFPTYPYPVALVDAVDAQEAEDDAIPDEPCQALQVTERLPSDGGTSEPSAEQVPPSAPPIKVITKRPRQGRSNQHRPRRSPRSSPPSRPSKGARSPQESPSAARERGQQPPSDTGTQTFPSELVEAARKHGDIAVAIVETLIGEETPLSSRQLAELLNRHQSTIVRICRRLKQDGILAARRGRNSGYFLKK